MFWLILSYIAAVLTTISFLPQAIKVIRTKDTKSISLIMYAAYLAGIICWAIYGFAKSDWAIFTSNMISIVFSSIIFIFKIINVSKGEKI